MINFHLIRWKNFLSTGNVWTKIELDKNPSTLIIGDNGAGKSTILDAITFALFGKPYRNINKPQLVNTVNGKDCMVELDFTINSKRYHVRRGIKPAVFDILVDDVPLPADSSAKEFQENFERTILRMNYKSFTQIVILGSASFTPFMQLSAADRRAVIEDLLDIQIFSNMNDIVKDRISGLKDEITECKIRLDSVNEKIELHKKHIDQLKRNNNDLIDKKQKELDVLHQDLVTLNDNKTKNEQKLNELLESITDQDAVEGKLTKLVSYESMMIAKQTKAQEEVDFFTDNDKCPTCKQHIDQEFKSDVIHDCQTQIKELDKGLNKLNNQKQDANDRLIEIKKVLREISNINIEINTINISLAHTKKYIQTLQNEIDSLNNISPVSVENKDQSQQLVDELKTLVDTKKKAIEEKQYYDMAAIMLKDSGIKSKIVKQYLPVINKMVNKYLSAMEFSVNFNINEEFKETIKSRHRDEFSYENFSEGEKQKIDLALLLTWRAIAKMKNSMNTNLLILDETFDSSLDSKGTDLLLQILHGITENTNVFVISHKDHLHDKFMSSIRFEKKQNFSRVVK